MDEIFQALNLEKTCHIEGRETYHAKFAVSELASHTIGAVGSAMAHLCQTLNLITQKPRPKVNRHRANLWFKQSFQPIGWEMPPIWDEIAGDYQTKDGWIKLHTNAPHHRAAALQVLKCEADRERIGEILGTQGGAEIEQAIIEAGGVAAIMRCKTDWRNHPQGQALARAPLIHWLGARSHRCHDWRPTLARPLRGLKVLDMTRILAGPVTTRTLAGFGATCLRIDPPGWDEMNVVPDIMLGKRSASLDLTKKPDRQKFEHLIAQADMFIHGLRPGALAGLGLDKKTRQSLNPNLMEVSLCAYGWDGPWARRRGYDSLVQMSCGIAHAGMVWAEASRPTPLPVQALDHATGYMMAAAAMRLLAYGVEGQGPIVAKLSLTRTANLLLAHKQQAHEQQEWAQENITAQPVDYEDDIEQMPWGKAKRLRPPLEMEGIPMQWQTAASALGASEPIW